MVNLADTKLSQELEVRAEYIDKKIKLTASYKKSGLDAELSIFVDPAFVLDAIAKSIPGETDDAVFALIKGAFIK